MKKFFYSTIFMGVVYFGPGAYAQDSERLTWLTCKKTDNESNTIPFGVCVEFQKSHISNLVYDGDGVWIVVVNGSYRCLLSQLEDGRHCTGRSL